MYGITNVCFFRIWAKMNQRTNIIRSKHSILISFFFLASFFVFHKLYRLLSLSPLCDAYNFPKPYCVPLEKSCRLKKNNLVVSLRALWSH